MKRPAAARTTSSNTGCSPPTAGPCGCATSSRSGRTADGGRRLVGIALDITSEKQEQADKRRIAQLYEALIENSSDNISLIRPDGITVYQSQAVQPELGYDPGELIGRNNFDLVHAEDVGRIQEQFKQLFESEAMIGPVRYRFRHKNGSWRCLESVAKRYDTPEGQTFAVVNTRDVTEVVKAQAELEATQDQLAQAMKMEAVGRLAGGVAHDFNNLLTVIAGYAELVSATLDTPDFRIEDLDEIKRAAHRASLLTRQLLAFSRKQVLRPEVLDINVVVREVGRLVSRLIGEDIELVLETTPAPLPVFGDRSQVEQVLMNLAVNARDAMPTGGRLIVRTAGTDSSVFLIVTDTGVGMLAGRARARVRAVLHHEGGGQGDRPGAVDGLRDRQAVEGRHQGAQRGQQGDGVHNLAAEGARDASGGAARRRGDAPGRRDDPPRRRRRPGPRSGGAGAAQVGLRRAHGRRWRPGDRPLPAVSGQDFAADHRHRHDACVGPAGLCAGLVAGARHRRPLSCPGIPAKPSWRAARREEGVAYLQKPFTPATLAHKVREVLDEALREPQAG